MNTTASRKPRRSRAWQVQRSIGVIAVMAALTVVTGCGGSGDGQDAETDIASQRMLLASSAMTPPLLDDEGNASASEPNARPSDAAAQTATGQYATRAQAEMLLAARDNGVLNVEVECCTTRSIDHAVALAQRAQAAKGLPASTLVLVSGSDLRLAAAAANRLAAGGLTHVWLVTP